ncbi:MAG: 4a-hydroxytetrahydrobiopterin dehydratase [Acidimicrobiia bacterium]
MELLTDEAIGDFLSNHQDWAREGWAIERTFSFSGFAEAMAFVNRVAEAAEKANHHPDIDIRWNAVTLRLSTHSAGGLTSKDTDLAAQVDTLI